MPPRPYAFCVGSVEGSDGAAQVARCMVLNMMAPFQRTWPIADVRGAANLLAHPDTVGVGSSWLHARRVLTSAGLPELNPFRSRDEVTLPVAGEVAKLSNVKAPIANSRLRVTGRDVADRAGVSQAAVSLILNGESSRYGLSQATQDRVLSVAAELDYVPNQAARSLRRRRTNVVTLVTSELGNPYLAEVAVAAQDAAARRNYVLDVVAVSSEAAGVDALRRLRAGGMSDGLMVHGGSDRVCEEVLRLRESGIGCVLIQDAGPETTIPCLRVDLTDGAILATRHLLSLGHRRIAHITDERLAAGQANDRLAGYRAALEQAGVPFDPALVIAGANSPAGGAAVTRALLCRAGPPPTALFAFNDQIAVGALHTLHVFGFAVPRDIAVVGFDGIALGEVTIPALTTVDHPRHDLGWLAANALLDLLEGKPPPQAVTTLPARLLIRQSCGGSLTP